MEYVKNEYATVSGIGEKLMKCKCAKCDCPNKITQTFEPYLCQTCIKGNHIGSTTYLSIEEDGGSE